MPVRTKEHIHGRVRPGRDSRSAKQFCKRILQKIRIWRNKWGIANYLEPDRRHDCSYLNKISEIRSSFLHKGQSGNWKILFFSHDANRGGAQLVLLSLLSWIKNHTFIDVKVVCLRGGAWLQRFENLTETLVLSDLKTQVQSEEELIARIEKFSNGIPDLIYGNSVASGRAYPFLRKLNAPIITHFHELEMSISKYASDCIEDVLKYSDHFIACSEPVRENLITNRQVPRSKITSINSSISSDEESHISQNKDRVRKRLSLKRNRVLIFGCGMEMFFRKGADLFIEVAQTLREKGYKNFHFYWIGGFDTNETHANYGIWAEHLNRLKGQGLHDYVTFLGQQKNVKVYLSAGDIFLLTSREDPFPLVCLEAAESSLPTVCFSGAGGLPDFVQDDAGYVVPFEDINAMAEKVADLIDDETLRCQLGRRARERLYSSFTVDVTAPQILSVCRNIAKQKPAVSVIVPNYNHARFLPRRLDSIFNQTFKDIEVILLDDASTDNSVEILNQYSFKPDVCLIQNDQNSGSSSRQWLKGMDLAHSDLLWISESDDFCEPNFLESLLPHFSDPDLKLAYADSYIVDEKDQVVGDWLETDYLKSLSKNKWRKSYKLSDKEEIIQALGVKNTILNASAVLFRRFTFGDSFKDKLTGLGMAGDWFVYLNAIHGGKLVYEALKLNYHRRHASSIFGQISNDDKKKRLFKEIFEIHSFIFNNYDLNEEYRHKWEKYLRQQWNDFFPETPFGDIEKYYKYTQLKQFITSNCRQVVGRQ